MTESVHGLPPLLSRGLRVAVVPPLLREDRWHIVEEVSQGGGSGQLVRLSGVKGIADAKALAGKTILAAIDDLPAGYALHDVDALLGREVCVTEQALVGTIDEVMVGPANDVWVVSLHDEQGTTMVYLLPVIDQVVQTVPPTGPIAVHIPAGLTPESVEHDDATDADSSPDSGELGPDADEVDGDDGPGATDGDDSPYAGDATDVSNDAICS